MQLGEPRAWQDREDTRPPVDSEIAKLVCTMALVNPLRGAPRIHGEILKLGLDVAQRTVARLTPRRTKPPSQTRLAETPGSSFANDRLAPGAGGAHR